MYRSLAARIMERNSWSEVPKKMQEGELTTGRDAEM